ncbi:MAG: MurR/RpiR family transcriptional regulator, partial [Acidobacteriota bacterium]
MPTTAAPTLTAPDVFKRIRKQFDSLTPELRRAARWITDHPGETGFLSMRQQAKSAGVSAPTMVRLARALGFDSYAALRRPF